MSYARALEIAEQAALAAGEILRRDFDRPGGARGGHGHADADDEAEALIRATLLEAFPDFGYRGEETKPDLPASADGHLWLVDPNDGTSSYLRGVRGAAVSIALLCRGEPVLGVVYAHTAPDHRGDLITWAQGCGPVRRRVGGIERTIAPSPDALSGVEVVLVADGAERRALANALLLRPSRFIPMPSIAYRLALVAAGDASATISLTSPQDWDFGAGHALLRGAGLELVDQRGRPVSYSTDGESRLHWCFGARLEFARQLAGLDWDTVLTGEREASQFPLLEIRDGSGKTNELDLAGPVAGECCTDGAVLARAQGCLLGQLAGDALGSLVEFRDAASIDREYPDGPRRLADGGTWHTIAGQPTDDSEMALALARSIVATGAYDQEHAAQAYAGWYGSGPFDVGTTTHKALGAIGGLHDPGAASRAQAAASRDSQANGSLMRISPLAIWGAEHDADALAELARADARLTHPHAACQDATAVFVVAVAEAIRGGGDGSEVYRKTVDWARRQADFDASVLQALMAAQGEVPADFLTHSGWVLIALQNAFHELVHAASFEEGVVRTVRRGGDTDTTAAICGALLGAVYGRDAVPLQWRQMVRSCRPLAGIAGVRHPRPRSLWPVDTLLLAERLWLCGTRCTPTTRLL